MDTDTHFFFQPGADPEGGGARPPFFAPNYLKSPWPKNSWERALEPSAPLPFSNPGSAPVNQ